MPASYPASVRLFTTKRDVNDLVLAEHVNTLQEEMSAVQGHLGLNPHVSSGATSATAYISASSVFASLAARLSNIEAGVLADVHTQYLHLVGGDTIVPSAADVRGLTVRARAGQTAPLARVESANGSTAFLEVLTTGVAMSAATVAGNRVLTTADLGSGGGTGDSTVVTRADLSNDLPSIESRTAGTSTKVSRGDHSHGPSSTKGFAMTIMGS